MKKLINNYLFKIWFVKHFLSALWMYVNGRWFVFRDAPLIVVEYVSNRKIKGVNADADGFVQAARNELQTRNFKRN